MFFFQAEDGIRDLVRSRGLGDVYKRQELLELKAMTRFSRVSVVVKMSDTHQIHLKDEIGCCLLYTSDAADERSSVDLGGRRIIKKTNKYETG